MVFAKKKFGQNFITDKNLITKIINILDQEKNQLIIEIGPGRGALTKELAKKFKKVIAIEIDKDLEPILKSEIKETNFELIIEDCLKVDFEKLIEANNFKKVAIISNTPYYITSEIIFKTLSLAKKINQAIFMVQKEVGQRLCATVNDSNYNNLSIVAQFYSDIKYEFTVNKNMFKPIPKVDSSIISLKFKSDNFEKIKDDKEFILFIKLLFNMKRKTILNNLTKVIKDKNKALQILDKTNILETLRPEKIKLEKYMELFNEVNKTW